MIEQKRYYLQIARISRRTYSRLRFSTLVLFQWVWNHAGPFSNPRLSTFPSSHSYATELCVDSDTGNEKKAVVRIRKVRPRPLPYTLELRPKVHRLKRRAPNRRVRKGAAQKEHPLTTAACTAPRAAADPAPVELAR